MPSTITERNGRKSFAGVPASVGRRNQRGSALFFAMCIGMMLLFEISLAWETGTTARLGGSLLILGRVERMRETSLLSSSAEFAISGGQAGNTPFEMRLPSGATFTGTLSASRETPQISGKVSGGPFKVWGASTGGQRILSIPGVAPAQGIRNE